MKNIGAVGGGDDDGGEDNKEKAEEEERERLEAIREAEERRKEKHRKMEEEREKMRQDIRDKVYTLMLLSITRNFSSKKKQQHPFSPTILSAEYMHSQMFSFRMGTLVSVNRNLFYICLCSCLNCSFHFEYKL